MHDCFTKKPKIMQFLVHLLQTAQSRANAGVTEDGHCQGACRPQWFFYDPNWDGTDINVILRLTRDTQSPMLRARFFLSQLPVPGIEPVQSADMVTTTPPTLSKCGIRIKNL